MLESQGSVVLRWHFNQNSVQLYGCTQFGPYKDKRPRHVTIVESQKKSLESLCNYAIQHIREPVCLKTQMAPANETLTTNLTSCHYWGEKRIGVYTYKEISSFVVYIKNRLLQIIVKI